MVVEWTEAYMDYNGLKSILRGSSLYQQSKQPWTPSRYLQKKLSMLRAFSGLNKQPSHSTSADIEGQVIDFNALQQYDSRRFYKTDFLQQSEEGEHVEAEFSKKLDEEHNKVSNFYKDRVEEVMDEANSLNNQMDALIALRVKVENSRVDGYSLRKPSSSDIPLRKINQAFSKIMTKYEMVGTKCCLITSKRASKSYMKIVDNSYIGSSEEVNNLLERVEATFIKHFANSNYQKGIKSLRPKAKKEKHRVTFFSECRLILLEALQSQLYLYLGFEAGN
ncbi:hypothetical protein SLEP1_g35776 [Rubroshorea leprosula]|uniref:SPX domain-containing protein n=1 Tax=Rubroshorea leprosula TaxID=152421 RepID=A0AAV5KPU3_9ROSI|nr:hypothetical protein SLEP1_g35776 [Rubroshorea leprosula]